MRKTILITGTSSGIGKSTVKYFQSKGWNVAATMRNPEKEKELIRLTGVQCFRLDVTEINSIQTAIKQILEKFEQIDAVVNNAAYNLTGAFEGASYDQIKSLYEVDVFGVMNVIREILPYFREKGKGMIINISSLGGRIGMPLSSFYASAKWAVEGFSESLRFELEKLNIKLKVVEPGAINTNFANNTIFVRKEGVEVYDEILDRRLARYEKGRSKLNDPVVVAKEIYRAVTDNKNKFRYLAGSDAKLFWKIKQVLPFSMFTGIVKKMAG